MNCELNKWLKWATNIVTDLLNYFDAITGSQVDGVLSQLWKNYNNIFKNAVPNTINLKWLAEQLVDQWKKDEFESLYDAFRSWAKKSDSYRSKAIQDLAYSFAQKYSQAVPLWIADDVDASFRKAISSIWLDSKWKATYDLLTSLNNWEFITVLKKSLRQVELESRLSNIFVNETQRSRLSFKYMSEKDSWFETVTKSLSTAARTLHSIGKIINPSNWILAPQQAMSLLSAKLTNKYEWKWASKLLELSWVRKTTTDLDNSGSFSVWWAISNLILWAEKVLVSTIPWYDKWLSLAENLNKLPDSTQAKIADKLFENPVIKSITNIKNNLWDTVDYFANTMFEDRAMKVVMDKHWISELEAALFENLPQRRQIQILNAINSDFNNAMQWMLGAARNMSGASTSPIRDFITMSTMYMWWYGFALTKSLIRWTGWVVLDGMSKIIRGDFKWAMDLLSDPANLDLYAQLIMEANLSTKVWRLRKDDDEGWISNGQSIARFMDNASSVWRYLQAPSLFSYGRIILWLQDYNSKEFNSQLDKDAATYKLSKAFASEFARQFQTFRLWDWFSKNTFEWILMNSTNMRNLVTLPDTQEWFGLVSDYMWWNILNTYMWRDQPNDNSYYLKKVFQKNLEGASILDMMLYTESLWRSKKYYLPWNNQWNYIGTQKSFIKNASDLETLKYAWYRDQLSWWERNELDSVIFWMIIPKEWLLKNAKNNKTTIDGQFVDISTEDTTLENSLTKFVSKVGNDKFKELIWEKYAGEMLDLYIELSTWTKGNGQDIYSSSKQLSAWKRLAEINAILSTKGLIDEKSWPWLYQITQVYARQTNEDIKAWRLAIKKWVNWERVRTYMPAGKKWYYSQDWTLVTKDKTNALDKDNPLREQFIAETFWDMVMQNVPLLKWEVVVNKIAIGWELPDIIQRKNAPTGWYSTYEIPKEYRMQMDYSKALLTANIDLQNWADPSSVVKWLTLAIKNTVYKWAESKDETTAQREKRQRDGASDTIRLLKYTSDRIGAMQGDWELKSYALVNLYKNNVWVMDYMQNSYENWTIAPEDKQLWEKFVSTELFRWASKVENAITFADLQTKVGLLNWLAWWWKWGWWGWWGWWPNYWKLKVPDLNLDDILSKAHDLQKRYMWANTWDDFKQINIPHAQQPLRTKWFLKESLRGAADAITKQPTGEQWWNTKKQRVFAINKPKPKKARKVNKARWKLIAKK